MAEFEALYARVEERVQKELEQFSGPILEAGLKRNFNKVAHITEIEMPAVIQKIEEELVFPIVPDRDGETARLLFLAISAKRLGHEGALARYLQEIASLSESNK